MDQTNQAPLTRPSTPINVLEVAGAQKAILWLIIIGIIAPFIIGGWSLLLGLVNLYFMYKLIDALGLQLKIVWMIFMLVPLINLILLLVLNAKATKVIREHGFKVGLMGANLEDIRSRHAQPMPPAPTPQNFSNQ